MTEPEPMKVTTVRLPVDQAQDLELVARIDGVPVSQVTRDAIAAHLRARRADPGFQARLKRRMAADEEILDRLAKKR
jgi:post-segregation antitoxin (ccd killing protein)